MGFSLQDVNCSMQALAIVVRPDFLSGCLIAELAPDAQHHHAFTTVNAGLHLGSHHIVDINCVVCPRAAIQVHVPAYGCEVSVVTQPGMCVCLSNLQ
jgi:hypothetical protein